jgi:MFS family permease
MSVILEGMEKTAGLENRFGAADYFKITVLGMALAAVANAMHAIILPVRIEDLAGAEHKSTYLGLITFVGLVIAIFVQPIAGAISDYSGFRWGRRKPFILTGIIAAILFLMGTGITGGYASLFVLWCLMQASANIAQGPFQAFIPDLVPTGKRGIASGVKNLLEIAGGIALLRLIGNFIGHYTSVSGNVWLWLSLGLLGAALLGTMLVTMIMVKEKPGSGRLAFPLTTIIFESFQINVKANSGFVLFLASRLLFIMALTTLQTFALYYFQDVVGVSNPAAVTADLIIAVGVAMLVVVYPAGRFSDKIGRKPILVTSGFLAALGIALIFLMRSYGLILFAGSLIGIAAGAFLSTNWALATDLVPRNEAARYMGLTNLASAGGAALARLIGPAIDFFNNYGGGLGYSVMLGACFIYFTGGALIIWRIRTSKQTKLELD